MDRSDWDARYDTEELIWHAEPNRFLVEETADLSPGRALDLACGEGRNAVWLAERGWDVTAVDFSRVGLEKARKLAASRGVEVAFVEADVTAWDPQRASFDLIVALYLQLPADARQRALRRAAAGLAPGGVFLVVGHDSTNIADGIGGPQDPKVLFSPADIAEDLDGLIVERAERLRRPVAREGGEVDAIDALVRAVRLR